jgi:hypothetical protein
VPVPKPFDPIAEGRRQWEIRWPEHADHMTAVTSVMRVQQLLSRVEETLKPYGLTFAPTRRSDSLAFARHGTLPMEDATVALNQASFGMPGLTPGQAAQVTEILYLIRATAGDV